MKVIRMRNKTSARVTNYAGPQKSENLQLGRIRPVVNPRFAKDLPRCEQPHPLYYLGALRILTHRRTILYLKTLLNHTLS